MTHGHSLEQTIDATHRALDERMAAATAPHRDLTRPRETYADTDGFLASASRHLAAVEVVLLRPVSRAVPDGELLVQRYLGAARRLELTLALVKARLYGEAHAIYLPWQELWAVVERQLHAQNQAERELVSALLTHGPPAELDLMAQRVFDAETKAPTRPHPHLPHTGMAGTVARRVFAVADRFWDTAEGRVVPEPVRPPPRRHDSLLAQYLVADPLLDHDAKVMEHHRHRRHPKP